MDDPSAAVVPAPGTAASMLPPEKAEKAVAGARHGTVLAPRGGVLPAEKAEDVAGGGRRRVFSVELRPGDTTIVSWRKLLKEAAVPVPPPPPAAAQQTVVGLLAGPSGAAHPTENDPNDPAQSNRFNAVIEKIERLYMGKHSSDEEDLDDAPDDDQYDTEDSFIDDAELDEYFEVENLTTKHNGYFVNKGRLEQIEFSSVETVAPKKRRRKDSSSSFLMENSKELVLGSCSDMDSMPLEAHKRSSFQMGKNLASSNLSTSYHYEGSTTLKNKSNGRDRIQKKNFSDPSTGGEHAGHLMISSRDVELPPQEIKEFDENKTAAPQAVEFTRKSRTNGTYDYPYPAHWDKDAPFQDIPKNMRRKEKYDPGQFSGLTTASNIFSTQPTHMAPNRRIEVSGTKKGTRLERAIRDLQNIVNEYKHQTLDVHEAETNCQATVKRRLPEEVKQKLAKVARLSTNQGKIPEDELINRLMGIFGHLVQRRTLKRNMKEMVESGLYAKQEKADKLRQVKMEIYEMIKARLATKPKVIEQKNDSADDFEVVNNDERPLKGKSVMDSPLEDRICDLYDLYVEGMDEDKGPQSRKLYVELANLWPQGYMDKVGIRDAISRSMDRRNLLHRQLKVRNEERIKRRRLAAAAKLRHGNPAVPQSALTQQIMQPPLKNSQPSMSSMRAAHSVANYGQNQGSRNADKVRETSVGAASDSNRNSSDTKKRKAESNPPKAAHHLQNGIEKQKPVKHADEANVSRINQMAIAIPSYDDRPAN